MLDGITGYASHARTIAGPTEAKRTLGRGGSMTAMPQPDTDNQYSDRRRFFEREIERLTDRLYGTALRLTRDPDDAEDVVAEAIGKAWARLDQLRDMQHLEGWLFQILNNTFISVWRRRQTRQALEAEIESAGTDESGAVDFSLFQKLHQPFLLWWSTPEDQFLNDLLQEDLQTALDSLPDSFRVVMVLVEVQGYTYDEAAKLLDIPLGTVRSRLSRARALLQKALWEQARDAGLVTDPQHPAHVQGDRQ